MAATRRDDLAKRLAERLDKAPPKGGAMRAPAAPPPSPATTRSQPKPRSLPASAEPASPRARPAEKPDVFSDLSVARRPRRGSIGTVLRGHLVADSVHKDGRRRKARLRAVRGVRVTWDDVMTEGLGLLAERRERTEATLDEVRVITATTTRRTLVQATLTVELDQRLVEIQLDLGERGDASVTYELLWATAIVLWLRSTENEAASS